MGKPTICIGENKDTDQLRGNREADQRLCFRHSDSKFLFYLSAKCQASSRSFLCLYRPVCVGPVRKPQCWFSHEVAQIIVNNCYQCRRIYRSKETVINKQYRLIRVLGFTGMTYLLQTFRYYCLFQCATLSRV